MVATVSDFPPSLRTSDRRHWCGNPLSPLERTAHLRNARENGLPRRTSAPRNDGGNFGDLRN